MIGSKPLSAALAPGAEPPQVQPTVTSAGRLRRVASAALLGGANELEIEHGSQIYRLRLTSLGKLILTK